MSRMTCWSISSGSSAFSRIPPKMDLKSRFSLFHISPPTGSPALEGSKCGLCLRLYARGAVRRSNPKHSLSQRELSEKFKRLSRSAIGAMWRYAESHCLVHKTKTYGGPGLLTLAAVARVRASRAHFGASPEPVTPRYSNNWAIVAPQLLVCYDCGNRAAPKWSGGIAPGFAPPAWLTRPECLGFLGADEQSRFHGFAANRNRPDDAGGDFFPCAPRPDAGGTGTGAADFRCFPGGGVHRPLPARRRGKANPPCPAASGGQPG